MIKDRTIQIHPLVRVEIYKQIIHLAVGATKDIWHVFFHARKDESTEHDWYQVAYVREVEVPHGMETTVHRYEILPERIRPDEVSASPFGIIHGMRADLMAGGLMVDAIEQCLSRRQRMVPWYDSFTGWLADECGFRVVGFAFEGFDSNGQEPLEDALERYLSCWNSGKGPLAEDLATAPWAQDALVKEDSAEFMYIQHRPYFQDLVTWVNEQRWHFPVRPLNHFAGHMQMIRERFEPFCH